jgi:hypothetical protein
MPKIIEMQEAIIFLIYAILLCNISGEQPKNRNCSEHEAYDDPSVL